MERPGTPAAITSPPRTATRKSREPAPRNQRRWIRAELILDHGWPASDVGFEQGEFDAVAYDAHGRIGLTMEARARTTGPDSLDKLVRAWMRFGADPAADLNNNAGRKWRELTKLCLDGPVAVWLVADGARWTLTARNGDAGPVLVPGGSPDRATHTDQ